jgi:hypothetical protein
MRAISAFASVLRGGKKVRTVTSRLDLGMLRFVPNHGLTTLKRLPQKHGNDWNESIHRLAC